MKVDKFELWEGDIYRNDEVFKLDEIVMLLNEKQAELECAKKEKKENEVKTAMCQAKQVRRDELIKISGVLAANCEMLSFNSYTTSSGRADLLFDVAKHFQYRLDQMGNEK